MSDREALRPEDEERLARYRAGSLSDRDRRAFEEDALQSDALSRALYAEESWDAAMTPERPVVAARRIGAWAPRVVLPLAASVAILAGILHLEQARRAPQEDPVRGAAAGALPLAPTGDVAAWPAAFTWSRDPGAASYRVDLFASDGARLATLVTPDTTVAASALSAAPLAAGAWRVVPLGPDGLERPAAPRTAFRIGAP